MHPDPLNQEQLAPLAITYQDFVNALPSVQPSAKRGIRNYSRCHMAKRGRFIQDQNGIAYVYSAANQKPELYLKVGIAAPAGVLMWDLQVVVKRY